MTSPFLTSLETRIENRQSFYGRFQLGPFDCGQGLTVANAFRRTLLSECSGLGIIVIQLEGASHEYSTLPGIQESVLEILLNLKQIVLTTSPGWSIEPTNLNRNLRPIVKQLNWNKITSNVSLVDVINPVSFSKSTDSQTEIIKKDNLNNRVSSTNQNQNGNQKIHNILRFFTSNNSFTELNNFSNPNKKFENTKNRDIKDIKNVKDIVFLKPKNTDSKNGNSIRPESLISDQESQNFLSQNKEEETKNKINVLNSKESKPNLNLNLETKWAKLGYINVQGPKIVRARDIKLPEPIRCVDPNQYIATLTYDGKLNIKLLICQGKNSIVENLLPIHFNQNWFLKYNYNWFSKQKIVSNPLTYLLLKNIQKNTPIKPKLIINRQLFLGWQKRKQHSSKKLTNKQKSSYKQSLVFQTKQYNLNFFGEKNKDAEKKTNYEKKINKLPISLEPNFLQSKKTSHSRPLIVDSVFMPVQKANYSVELDDTFHIKKERIILEIWTNGSIHPRKAISLAAKRLVHLFYAFVTH